MRKIDIEQVKKQPDTLFQFASSEEEVIITQNEQSLFKLVRLHPMQKRRQSGSAKGLISMSFDFDQPLYQFSKRIIEHQCPHPSPLPLGEGVGRGVGREE